MAFQRPAVPPTLAEQRARFSHDDLAFCTSYLLYILVERGTRPKNPEYVEIACQRFGNKPETRMMAFRSPLDAMMAQIVENRQGRHYEILPFELLDPRPFMKKHGDMLRIALVYAFAAKGGKVLSSKDGGPYPLPEMMNFGAPPDYSEHFHLVLNENFMDWMNRQAMRAGLIDYGETCRELSEAPLAELKELAHIALAQVSSRIIRAGTPIPEYAFFDTIERCWRSIPTEYRPESGRGYGQTSTTIN